MAESSTSKPIIAVDIDDVIAESALAFVTYSNKKYGTHLTVDDYQDYWGEVWKTDYEETQRRAKEYHASGYIATYAPIEGAYKALRQLKERFKIVVLTSRSNSTNQLTRDWIEKQYPDIFDDIVFSGFYNSMTKSSSSMTKGGIAKSLGARYLIDDQIKHVLSAAELGMQGILFGNYSWNQARALHENVTRVRNWQEVLSYFESR